jgi:hypothetical protein
MQTFSKAQAARLLGISTRTLTRRVAAGTIRCKRVGEGQFAELAFSADELRRLGATIPEPVTVTVEAAPEPQPTPEPAPQPQPSAFEQHLADDLAFAEAYLRGEASDSAGNKHDGSNSRFLSGQQSLLGPQPARIRTRPSTTGHMNAALVGGTPQRGTDGEVVAHAGSDNAPLLKNFTGIPAPTRLRHPNSVRQEILSGVLAGWSR